MSKVANVKKFEEALGELLSQLDDIAATACEKFDVESVHFVVGEQRRLHNLHRQLAKRGILGKN